MVQVQCRITKSIRLSGDYADLEAEVFEGEIPAGIGIADQLLDAGGKEIPVWSASCMGTDPLQGSAIRLFIRTAPDSACQLELTRGKEITAVLGPEQELGIEQEPPGGGRQLIFTDAYGVFLALPVLHKLFRSRTPFRLYGLPGSAREELEAAEAYARRMEQPSPSVKVCGEKDISPLLERQTVGTRITVIGQGEKVRMLLGRARDAGFSEDELRGIELGLVRERIFCVSCYQLQLEAYEEGRPIICPSCEAPLLISRHYSHRLNAYLGYVEVR